MTEKRVLNGYSKEVQADFKKFKKDCCYPLLETISGLEIGRASCRERV